MPTSNQKFSYFCNNCSLTIEEHPSYCPKCGSTLNITGRIRYNDISLRVDATKKSLWRYLDLLPVEKSEHIISLDEGFTPLKKSKYFGDLLDLNLYLKDETGNPTGSFKDRGMSVAVSYAKSIGIKKLGAVSTGNSGLSFSMFCGVGEIEGNIFVPDSTTAEKKFLLKLYGGKLNYFSSELQDTRTKEIELSTSENLVFVKAHLHAYYFEGQKTLGFEILEQLNWQVPDFVVVPTGGATLLLSMWKGFEELKACGMIDRIPRPVCVQATGCSPITKAFKEGAKKVSQFENSDTIADSIRLTYPSLGDDALLLLKKYNGIAEDVCDKELVETVYSTAQNEGLFVEPACATAIAALKKLKNNSHFKENDTVVSIMTGHGFKSLTKLSSYKL